MGCLAVQPHPGFPLAVLCCVPVVSGLLDPATNVMAASACCTSCPCWVRGSLQPLANTAMRRMQDGRTKLFYGIVLSSYCVGQIIGAVVLGSGAARMGYKPVLFASLATELVGYAAYALTPNAWVIMASRLVAGIGAGTCATGCGDSATASTCHGMG